MKPKTYELLGLAIAGTCLGFLLPFWVPDVVGTVLAQARVTLEAIQSLSLARSVGLGFWFGVLLVGKGFLGRWRERRLGGERP